MCVYIFPESVRCLSVVRPSSVPLFALFLNVLILLFTKVESPIDRLLKKSLVKSYERTLVSDLASLALK